MDPNLGVLIMNESMKMKAEIRKSMLKAASFRHRLKNMPGASKTGNVRNLCVLGLSGNLK